MLCYHVSSSKNISFEASSIFCVKTYQKSVAKTALIGHIFRMILTNKDDNVAGKREDRQTFGASTFVEMGKWHKLSLSAAVG